jgi:7-carboxy-7-deazaguanine synthase
VSLSEILDRVASYNCDTVCVTGGEPLAQAACLPLLSQLCAAGYAVSLETSGALDIAGVDSCVSRIVDLKAPDSGEADKNRWENLALLRPGDELKIVLASRSDYEWAKSALAGRQLACPVLFSPVAETLPPVELAQWILEDRLPVRFQMQMHKLLWGNARGK